MSAIIATAMGMIFGYLLGWTAYVIASSLDQNFGQITRAAVVITWISMGTSIAWLLIVAVTP